MQSPCDWAEAHVVLPPRIATPFPGPYRAAITPYVRGILDALNDVRTHTVVVAKGAQTGLTQAAYVALAYWTINDPGPVLLVYPNEDLARSTSETRVMPIFEDSPTLAAEIPPNRRDDWTKLQYKLRRCTVNWVGSNSPASLAMRPCRYLILDEVDKYPPNVGREADPVNLAMQRTKTFWNRKRLMISTPTVDTGAIWRHYLAGDQRKFYVPCHACGRMQVLTWGSVKFNSKLPIAEAAAGACYECDTCKAPWTNQQKVGALQRGEWRATATSSDGGLASFHLSGLYAPWVTWADLVAKFLRTRTSPTELRDFVNSDLGEPFMHYENRIKDAIFQELEGDYVEGEKWWTLPAYADQYRDALPGVFVGADVQKGHIVAVVRAFVVGGDSGLLWRGTVANLERLEQLADEHAAEWVLIDQRYRTREVQEWCYGKQGCVPCLGVTRKARALFTQSNIDLDEGRRGQGGGRVIAVLEHDADMLKDILAAQVQRDEGARRWMIPRGVAADVEYVQQMTAERSVNGKWVNPTQRANHFWDAEALALLGAVRFGYWQQAEEQTEKVKHE